ncbi:MAG: hypothetical protein ACI3XQ_00655 [Eubacteriales bacterium]
MKRKISFLLLMSLLVSSVLAFGVSATENTITRSNGLDSSTIKDTVGSMIQATTTAGNFFDGTHGLQFKTTNGSAITRHTNLFSFDQGVVPIGTYTVSVWVRYTTNSTDWYGKAAEVNSEIALILYDIGVDDTNMESAGGTVVKLVPNSTQDTSVSYFSRDEDTAEQTVGTRTWHKFKATVTLDQPCQSAAFWILDNGTAESKTYYAYVDELEITGTPEEQTQDILFRGMQCTTPDEAMGTFSIRLLSTINSLDFNTVGYEITVKTETQGTWRTTVSGQQVFEKVLGTENGVSLDYEAGYFNARYICALTVQNLPSAEDITITFTPFAGTSKDTEYTAVYDNGVLMNLEETNK